MLQSILVSRATARTSTDSAASRLPLAGKIVTGWSESPDLPGGLGQAGAVATGSRRGFGHVAGMTAAVVDGYPAAGSGN
jgi:hypothetical protein